MTLSPSAQTFQPIKVVDVELSQALVNIDNLDGYIMLKVLVRLHGAPLGYVPLGVTNGRCLATTLGQAILDRYSWPIIRHLISDGLASPLQQNGLRLADLTKMPHPDYSGPFPLVTIAVCTRDRVADLAICLDALSQLNYPALDLMVIDNAPTNDDTKHLVLTDYPTIRYVCEPRPGLSWARNRAINEARGQIIAFTDDDVVVDLDWAGALAQIFAENPEVMAVTGLVVPYELETEAQLLFEDNGGFGRGFERKWFRVDPWATTHLGAGEFGTGANMAYRLSLFNDIGYFDPALGVGTVTCGGEDLEMFFRVLQEGYTLVYEPNALVRHRHRSDYASLKRQLFNNGIGLASYHTQGALNYPNQRSAFIKLHLGWLWQRHIKRLLKALTRPQQFPLDLIWAELKGYLIGLSRYPKARRTAEDLAQIFGSPVSITVASVCDDRQITSYTHRPNQYAETMNGRSVEHVSI